MPHADLKIRRGIEPHRILPRQENARDCPHALDGAATNVQPLVEYWGVLYIAAEVNRSREDFIAEYYSNYTAPSFPPAWKTLEVVSFGTLSKLFCNFKDNSVKKKVAKEFKLPLYLYLENWIKCIAVLRNACAHHARIWNRRFPTMPIMPEYLPSSWVVIGNFRPNKLYHQLCCLAYLEQSIAANGNFSKRHLVLMEKNENINTRSMGFPQEWKNEPLWNM